MGGMMRLLLGVCSHCVFFIYVSAYYTGAPAGKRTVAWNRVFAQTELIPGDTPSTTSSSESFKAPIVEINRRRNFAIISHPDAGKTTLTEKLLLFGGAIQDAGAVKARADQRKATSDWMEIEKARGISVTSTVLSFNYHLKQVSNDLSDLRGPAPRPHSSRSLSASSGQLPAESPGYARPSRLFRGHLQNTRCCR